MPSFRPAALALALLLSFPTIATVPAAQAQSLETASIALAGVRAYEAGDFDNAARYFSVAGHRGNRLAQYNFAMML